ncbi:MAG: hypothetical protein ACRD3E_06680, partial [Terriglobales bacterium]
AIAMFAWVSIAHMATPLANAGVSELPNESPVLQALQTSAGENSGLYMYPGFGLGAHPTMSQLQAAMPEHEKKLATTPSGLLIYHPPGRPSMTTGTLLVEFGKEFVQVLLAMVLLSVAGLRGYGSRVAFVAVIGVIESIGTNVSYWDWYGFPGTYTVAQICIMVIAFVVAGLVGAAIVKGERKSVGAAA